MRGRAIAQAVSRCLVKWDLWRTKWRWGRFSPSTSVSHANLPSTKFSIIIITGAGTLGHSVADVASGPSLDSTPHYANLKKKVHMRVRPHHQRVLKYLRPVKIISILWLVHNQGHEGNVVCLVIMAMFKSFYGNSSNSFSDPWLSLQRRLLQSAVSHLTS
jgi:hypothetical protein